MGRCVERRLRGWAVVMVSVHVSDLMQLSRQEARKGMLETTQTAPPSPSSQCPRPVAPSMVSSPARACSALSLPGRVCDGLGKSTVKKNTGYKVHYLGDGYTKRPDATTMQYIRLTKEHLYSLNLLKNKKEKHLPFWECCICIVTVFVFLPSPCPDMLWTSS